VLLIGVGRSGTSAFTGILRELGFHVPQPEVEPDETNPRGFGEPRWAVDWHTRLLKRVRVTTIDSRPSAWAKTADIAQRPAVIDELRSWLEVQFVGTSQVVVKDPRVSWFLDLWQRCAADLEVEPTLVTMLRPPTEVLGSARQWYGGWQNDASRAAGWANIMLHTEQQGRDARRLFIRYDRLLTDWSAELGRLGRVADVPDLLDVAAERRERVATFIDPSLRRQTPGWDGLDVPAALRAVVDRTWQALEPLADDGAPVDPASLDAVRAGYDEFYAEAEAVAQSSIRAAENARRRTKPAPPSAPAAEAPSQKSQPPKPSPRRRARRAAARLLFIRRA